MKEKSSLLGSVWFLSPTLVVVLLTFTSSGCRPDLPVPGSNPLTNSVPPEFVVRIEPEAPLEFAPRVLRLHVSWPSSLDEARIFLIRGEVTDYHLRQIERDDLTKTLLERIVPALVWFADENDLVIAPTEVLEPGQTYAVASGEPSKVVHFVVRDGDEPTLLARIWPPLDVPSRLGIYCGATLLPDVTVEVKADPLGPIGVLARGMAKDAPGAGCLHWQALGRGEDEKIAWVLPPLVQVPGIGSTFVQMEPGRLEPPIEMQEMAEIVPLECDRDEIEFGPGCAVVTDDRAFVRAPEGELLWGISAMGMERMEKTASKERFVVQGLLPESDIFFDVVTMDPFGRTQRMGVAATTSALTAHVVLNEVVANPIGPEPDQEWVELYNDGQVETSLSGYRILDIGGETVLPDVVLPAGQYAVVVNETFYEDDEVDVIPRPGTILVRVSALGKNGLSNSGELLRLVNPEGRTISRFPALPKPKAGQSVSRLAPDAPDGVSSSFAPTVPTPGMVNKVTTEP
jgi:Lamin Tail Domain